MTTIQTLRRLAAALVLAAFLGGCGGGDDGAPPPQPGVEEGASLDIPTSVELLQLCLESYQMLTDFESGKTFTLPPPYTLQAQFDTIEHFFGEDTSGPVPIAFIATRGTAIYVVFRGTKTISEWISDATFSQVNYAYVANAGKVEKGFNGIYASIHSAMTQKVASLASGGTFTTLYITGHSLGAALAVLAAPDFAAHTPFNQPVVYTFAGPRAGDPLFALFFNGNIGTTWRVVNTNDEAPKVPNVVTTEFGPPPERKPEVFFFEHVNTEYPITFGQPIRSLADLIFNHSSCNYYATLCDKTGNPTQCKARGQGLNGCSF